MILFIVGGALIIGFTLGLLGSGGSILTVPILVYLIDEPEKLAIGESLGIVALISLSGFIPYVWKNQVHWRSIFFFGVPGIGGTWLGAWMSQFISGKAQLIIFSVVMLVAAILMLFKEKAMGKGKQGPPQKHAIWKIILEGLFVGILTGTIGIGGGFLIVPALVLLGGLSMYLAVGTSLGLITINSLVGLISYTDILAGMNMQMNWSLIGIFGLIGTLGAYSGKTVGSRFPQKKLRKIFAIFLLAMGTYMMTTNF